MKILLKLRKIKLVEEEENMFEEGDILRLDLEKQIQLFNSPDNYLSKYFNDLKAKVNQEMEELREYLEGLEQNRAILEERLNAMSQMGFRELQIQILRLQMNKNIELNNKKLSETWQYKPHQRAIVPINHNLEKRKRRKRRQIPNKTENRKCERCLDINLYFTHK
jgi:hypothetical protein